MRKTLSNVLKPGFEGIIFMPYEEITSDPKGLMDFKILKKPRFSMPKVFNVRKILNLTRALNSKIGAFQSAGLINYWSDGGGRKRISKKIVSGANIEPTKLTLKQLEILFDILLAGLFLSLAAFIFEIIYYRLIQSGVVF
jgi:hypothetical protein